MIKLIIILFTNLKMKEVSVEIFSLKKNVFFLSIVTCLLLSRPFGSIVIAQNYTENEIILRASTD